MYEGPILAPDVVPKLSFEFEPYLFAMIVLTGCLLLFWVGDELWKLVRASARSVARIFSAFRLSEFEIDLLRLMSDDPIRAINLDNMDYSRTEKSKLEFYLCTKQLESKGLASINELYSNLVSLTELGCKRALQIHRAGK